MTPAAAALWLLGLNAITLTAFAFDKRQARRNGWRIPERSLLTFALLGGWPAAKAGQHLWRHKTRKEPFRTRLNTVVALWLGVLAVLLWLS